MKRIPKAIYQTAEQIDARIKILEDDAMTLKPSSEEHRAIMREIAQLRVYAETRRWLAVPAKQVV
jgi:hypothetical protein